MAAGTDAIYPSLQGRTVLVTGGASGIGEAIVRRFASQGARVGFLDIAAERGEALADELAAAGGEVRFVPCDLTDIPALREAVQQVADALGTIRVLVNNAAGNFLAKSEELSARGFDAVTGIVLNGTAYVTLGCGRRWLADERPGTVLSIVATYAWTGSAYVVPSACAKAGVRALTQSLAVEWGGRGIRLNAIAPGPFPTEGAWERLVPTQALEDSWRARIPSGRFGEHGELADLAIFLLSDNAGYINGEVVAIDGGEWLKGAGQFNFMEQMTEAQWDAANPKRKKG